MPRKKEETKEVKMEQGFPTAADLNNINVAFSYARKAVAEDIQGSITMNNLQIELMNFIKEHAPEQLEIAMAQLQKQA